MMSAANAGKQAQDEKIRLMLEDIGEAITGEMPPRKMALRIEELEAELKACKEGKGDL